MAVLTGERDAPQVTICRVMDHEGEPNHDCASAALSSKADDTAQAGAAANVHGMVCPAIRRVVLATAAPGGVGAMLTAIDF